jgi:hypothetical protein
VRAAILGLAAFCSLAAPVQAHEEQPPAFEAVLDRVVPQPARLEVRLVDTLAPQMLIANRTGRVLEVLDARGTPVIRIGHGAAWVNAASPAYYAQHPVSDRPAVPERPRWVLANRAPSWGWFDPRIQADALAGPTVWHIDMRLGGGPVTVSGRFRARPVLQGSWRPVLLTHSTVAPLVDVAVVPGVVPAMTIDNGGDEPVTIIGARGEKFLRISADGVFANTLSPTWLQSGRAPETASAIAPARDRQAVRWTRISAGSRYTWLEWRARCAEDRPDRTPMTWQIPLLIGGKPVTVRGETDWIQAAARPSD